MCFSAPASFATSAVLTAAGAASYAGSKNRTQKLLSLIPIAFAIQQAIEGYQWLSIGRGAVCTEAGYGFYFFAFLFWPSYIPAMMLLNEKRPRKILYLFMILGLAFTTFYTYAMMIYPLNISVLENRIAYSIDIPYLHYLFPTFVYLLATCGSLIASRDKRVRIFGSIFLLSAVISAMFYWYEFISVWCFFSALLSGLIYVYIRSENKQEVLR